MFWPMFLAFALYLGVVLGDDCADVVVPVERTLPLGTQSAALLGELGLEFGDRRCEFFFVEVLGEMRCLGLS